MVKTLEFVSMLILGILLVLAFTHFLNGTFGSWVSSKFTTRDAEPSSALKAASSAVVGGGVGAAAAKKVSGG